MPIQRVLITGANGFLGSQFLKAANRRDATEVIGLSRRISPESNVAGELVQTDYSADSLKGIFKEFRPDLIIHAAGASSVANSVSDPITDYQGSAGLAERLLNALSASGIAPTLFYSSTAAVYGNPSRMPIREDDETRPISPYGTHRLMCEKLFLDFAREHHSIALVGRAFSLFGPEQKKLVLWEMANQALRSDTIVIQGSGKETRDFLSGAEFARRALLLTDSSASSNVVNIASGTSLSVEFLAQLIAECLGKKVTISRKNLSRPGDPQHWAADVERYKEITGDLIREDFKRVLLQTLINWMPS